MYQLSIKKNVRRQLLAAPSRVQIEAKTIIAELRDDPYPMIAEELRDQYKGIWKIKVDGWRIFYEVKELDRQVIVLAVKRRTPNTYNNIF